MRYFIADLSYVSCEKDKVSMAYTCYIYFFSKNDYQLHFLYRNRKKISIGCFRPFWLIRIKGYAIFLHSCNKHRSKSLAFSPGSEKEKRNSSIGSMNTSCIDIISWCINTKLILKTNNNRRL